MRIFTRSVLITVITLALGGCSSIFNYGAEKIEAGSLVTLETIKPEAERLANAYADRSSAAISSRQAFDVPIIGAALTAVSGLALGAHPDFGIIAGIAGGSLSAYRTYYSPAERSKIYTDGAAAMGCIGNLTGRLLGNATTSNSSAAPNRLVDGASTLAAHEIGKRSFIESLDNTTLNLDPVDMSFVTRVIDRLESAPRKLELAIYQINSKITSRASDASGAPQYATVVSQLRQVITEEQGERQQAKLISDKHSRSGAHDEVDLLTSKVFVDALELDTEITACTTIAGGA